MGNSVSTPSKPPAVARETQGIRQIAGRGDISAPSVPELLFLGEIEAEPATWSQESMCVTVQRLLGWLPDSTVRFPTTDRSIPWLGYNVLVHLDGQAEKLKQDQKAPEYMPRITVEPVAASASRGDAIIVVQRVYRRYRLLCKWHNAGALMLAVAQRRIEARIALEEEEELLNNFRQILSTGFSAQKVSITGALKNVQLQLVLNATEDECYLTWTPSKKRQPRIHLHDIAEVVPVLKDSSQNKHAPRLANKVSHRRGLIIVCKSHHRGRVVLQMSSKRERKVLLLGFRKLLEELDRFAPTFDNAGAIRKRIPRRQSAVLFFDTEARQIEPVDGSIDNDASVDQPVQPIDAERLASNVDPAVSPWATNGHSIARFYETRFDELAPDATETAKPSVLRRSTVKT